MARPAGGFLTRLGIDPPGAAVAIAVWLLPMISTELLWLQFFAPLPVLYYLFGQGARGVNTLAAALLVTGLTATMMGAAAAFFFSATMLPAGYVLATSAGAKDSPVRSGLMALIVMLLGWGLWTLLYGMVNGGSLYGDILAGIDQGLVAAGQALKESSELPAEQALALEVTVETLRDLVPRIMPGLVLLTMVNAVFLNMVIGRYLLARKDREQAPWPPFSEWRLPEQLVALVITAGILALLPAGLPRDAGLNIGLLAGALYLYQGMAVLAFLLNRWQVPMSLRVLIFLLVIFQAVGLVALALLGLADIWIDFRRERPDKNEDEDEEDNEL